MNENFDKNKLVKIAFWGILFFIFLVQIIFTLNSLNQIRYEEVAESIRNVYWLDQRLVYDGVSSNIGWYGILLSVYKLFGFNIFAAKILKLVFFSISIFLTACMLKKWLGYKKAFIPLIAIGFSPSFLFLNTLNVQFGLDFLIIPILIFIILNLTFKKNFINFFLNFVLGFILIISLVSYPIFLFYVPLLIFLYIYIVKKVKKISPIFHIFPLIAGIFLLFPLAIFYINNSNLLFYDPINKSGMFRGAGNLNLSLSNFLNNTASLATDLFITGKSYYYEVLAPDFSHIFPIFSVLAVFTLVGNAFIKNKTLRKILLIVLITSIINYLSTGFLLNVGIRRNTPIIFSFYILYVVAFYQFFKINFKSKLIKNVLFLSLLILPIHHLLALPLNLDNMNKKSKYQYELYFTSYETPMKSINIVIATAQKEELRLDCIKTKKGYHCRFNEIYPLIMGACKWNSLSCKKVLGYDPKKNKYVPLSLKLWKNYYWEH